MRYIIALGIVSAGVGGATCATKPDRLAKQNISTISGRHKVHRRIVIVRIIIALWCNEQAQAVGFCAHFQPVLQLLSLCLIQAFRTSHYGQDVLAS